MPAEPGRLSFGDILTEALGIGQITPATPGRARAAPGERSR